MFIHHFSKSRIALLTSALLLTSSGVLGEGTDNQTPNAALPASTDDSNDKDKSLDIKNEGAENKDGTTADWTTEPTAGIKTTDKDSIKSEEESKTVLESINKTDLETPEAKDSIIPSKTLELTMDDVTTKTVTKADMEGSPMSHMAPLGVSDAETNMENILHDIFSREKVTKTDSVQAAMVSAYQTNPDIRDKRSALRAADEQIVQAKAGWRPKIEGNVSAGLKRSNYAGDSVDRALASAATGTASGVASVRKDGTKEASITATQNLYKGGQTLYETRAANATIKQARASLEFAEQSVFYQTTQAYLELLTKYVELELLRRNEDSLKKTLDVTMAKFEVGEETRTSVAQAEGEYAQAVARRYTAEAELEGDKALFERVTNRKAGVLTRPDLPKIIPTSLETVLEKLRINNPEIIAAQYDEKAARHKVDSVQSGMFPELNLVGTSSASLDRNKSKYGPGEFVNPGTNNKWLNDKTVQHSVALQLKIPIYEQGLIRSQTRGAAETAEQKRIIIETIRRRIVQEAIKAWNDFIQAKESIEYYKIQVKARVASLEGVRQEYAVGSKILLDVLNEMTRLIRAQLELVQNEKVYYDAAYRILYYMGDLSARAMKLNVELYDPIAHYEEVKNKL